MLELRKKINKKLNFRLVMFEQRVLLRLNLFISCMGIVDS